MTTPTEAVADLARRLIDLEIPPTALPGVREAYAQILAHGRRLTGT